MATWRMVWCLALALAGVFSSLGDAHAAPVKFFGKVTDNDEKPLQVWIVAWGHDGIPGVDATLLGYVKSNAKGEFWLSLDAEGVRDKSKVRITFVLDDRGTMKPAMNDWYDATSDQYLGQHKFPKEMAK